MTLLTGLLILAAILVAVALAVLSTIAAVAEILPPRSGQGDEPVNTSVSAPRAPAPQRQNRMPTRIGMKSQ
jgi:hypothetical protein